MQVKTGINPNCSETVYRLKKVDWEKHKSDLEDALSSGFGTGSLTPVEGYSHLRPGSDEICVYYYQTFGGDFMSKLEELEIPYDSQQWLTHFDWESADAKYDMLSDDENEGIFRRKPYKVATDESV